MSEQRSDRPATSVSLVLGAGGPVGRAFHAGALRALADGCGWDARLADLIVGTSAGAQVGALLRAGMSAHDLFDRAASEAALPTPVDGTRARWPSSPAYLRRMMRRPWLARPGRLLAAALPEGRQNNHALGQSLTDICGERWPTQPLWITAVHLDSGARVVFGRGSTVAVDVGTAVRCSSAVPSLRRPVHIGAERYVDGGIASPTHADLVDAAPAPAAAGFALVLSPLSRFAPLRLLLRAELRALARRGISAVALEPDREVVAAMGWNPMDARVAPRVAEIAYRTTLAQIRRSDGGRLRRWLSA